MKRQQPTKRGCGGRRHTWTATHSLTRSLTHSLFTPPHQVKAASRQRWPLVAMQGEMLHRPLPAICHLPCPALALALVWKSRSMPTTPNPSRSPSVESNPYTTNDSGNGRPPESLTKYLLQSQCRCHCCRQPQRWWWQWLRLPISLQEASFLPSRSIILTFRKNHSYLLQASFFWSLTYFRSMLSRCFRAFSASSSPEFSSPPMKFASERALFRAFDVAGSSPAKRLFRVAFWEATSSVP
mmetsp:Transcript_47/g.61  ORF Transcript_47/g.61 Transcript_47/m.61 type:complete len:240 (+) Transcript_47:18-737(+)